MKNPLRCWRTGAIAVVLAALGGAGFADDAITFEKRSIQRLASPFSVDETVLRIEVSARQRGVSVFGCFDEHRGVACVADGGARARSGRVIVLESMQGGTPVLMSAGDADGSAMALPLSIRVRPGGDGRSEVWVESSYARQDLLQGLELDLAALDDVVHGALRA